MIGITICSHPDCQTSAGCVCDRKVIASFLASPPPVKTYQDGLAEGRAKLERVREEIINLRQEKLRGPVEDCAGLTGLGFALAIIDAHLPAPAEEKT